MMLSNSQRKFCQLVVDGVSQTEAYLQTYNGCKSRNAAGASATRMLRNVKIQQEIERLRKDMENDKELTRLKKRQILCDIATDDSLTANLRIQAISADNKMMGHDEPETIELGITGLDAILRQIRAKKD